MRTCIINSLCPKIIQYSQQKYASNVIEKCFLQSSEEDRAVILQYILRPLNPSDSTAEHLVDANLPDNCLSLMVRDQYGNYVIQKILDHSSKKQRDLLIAHLYPHAAVLKKYVVVFCCLMLSHVVFCCLMLSHVVFCCLMLSHAVSCCLMLSSAVSCCLMLSHFVFCCLMLSHVVVVLVAVLVAVLVVSRGFLSAFWALWCPWRAGTLL